MITNSEGTDASGSSNWQKVFNFSWKLLALAALYSLSQWLIVSSPISRPAPLRESVGTIIAASMLAFIIFFIGSLFSWLFLRGEKRRYIRETATAVGTVTLVFAVSIFAVTILSIDKPIFGEDSGSVLLSAASLSLFVFSTLVAVAALVGLPNFERYVNSKVQEKTNEALVAPLEQIREATNRTNKELQEIRNELRGRSLSYAGLLLGELSLGRDSFVIAPHEQERFESAVESCLRGFRELENSSAVGPRLMALNNWLYYSSFKKNPLSELTDDAVIAYARELEKAGRANGQHHLLLTYCRVIGRRSTDAIERDKARSLLEKMIGQLSPLERREAQDCIQILGSRDQADN